MAFTFRPAARTETNLLIGLAGPSGSGKTASSLILARGILGGDDGIFLIDTEADRAAHYACGVGESPSQFRFRFQHGSLRAPFTPEAYQGAIEAAVTAGAKVVIVDSMSHEHEGPGGILESHDVELTRMAGTDRGARERMKFAAWIKPKLEHNKFVNFILQQRCHFIFCFRAKDKLKLVKNAQGKLEPVQLGWTAICPDRFEYEMTTLLMLPPTARGVPDLDLPSTKINAHHVPFFPVGKPITEQAGAALAAWATGGGLKPANPPTAEKPKAEKSVTESTLANEAQRNAVRALARKKGLDDDGFINWLGGEFGVETLLDLPAAQVNVALKKLEAVQR